MSEPAPPASSGDLPGVGSWVRAEGVVGVVAAVAAGTVTVFAPGPRRSVVAAADAVEVVPAGAVTIRSTVTLPVPHGLDEPDLRRWVAALLDPVLRERAATALSDAGLDQGSAEAEVDVEVIAPSGDALVCLAGHRSSGAQPRACPACGRPAVPPLRTGGRWS